MANLRVDKITSTETFETTGSVQFDGSGDYLDVTESNNDFDFDEDFTIETWIYFNGITSNNSTDFLGSANNSVYLGSSKSGWIAAYYTLNVTGLQFRLSYQSNSAWEFELGWDYTANTGNWYHVAYTRKGGVIDCYINGVKLARSVTVGTVGEGATITSSEGFVRVGGGHGSTSKLLNGHLSNTRILKGKALYTSNFKPPMRELEVVPGTVLLACQSKTDASLEKTGKTITANGNAVANELTPGILTPIVKSGGGSAITGSVEFGENDYLTLTPSTDFNFGTGDFTIEFWIHPQKIFTSYPTIFEINDSVNASKLYINFRNGANLALTDATTVFAQNGLFNLDDWFHVAVVRTSGQSRLYMNGVGGSSVSCTRDFGGSNNGIVYIGWDHTGGSTEKYNGFISNLRIVKGTALYTDDFIPPTRELKKVPGTVLLCCQDPNNPLTEATGKTITPYGSLGDGGLGQELVTNNSVWTMTCGGTSCTNWTASNNGRSLAGTTVASGYIRATYTIPKGDYLVSFRWTGGAFAVQSSAGYVVATDGTDTEFGSSEDGAYSVYMSDTTYVRFTGTSWSTAYTVDDISIKRIYKNNGATNFTPQVGNDRKVTFEGVTKINTDAYFYLPTGDTESRDKGAGTRGISFGGGNGTVRLNTISYINISTTGNAENFGDLLDKLNQQASAASSTRGISAGGFGTSPTSNEIDTVNYITMASTGDAIDFGDLTLARRLLVGCSSQTRGIFAGGYDAPNKYNTMDYITIASTGDALDFGDMVADDQTPNGRYSPAGYASPTRGVWHGGYGHPAYRNIIDYVTIASKGNTKDFGDSAIANYYMGGCSNNIRGISGGAYNPSPAHLNLIEYTTIATTGNAKDFGDLNERSASTGACASQIRGIFIGAEVGGSITNNISYITIMSMGNALDFGDLTGITAYNAGCSNGHGGLG